MPAFDFVLAERYRLVAPLGEGGMAAVYRGRDLRLNRDVAIKILRDELTLDPAFLARFNREAQFVASLSHPNIVNVYDVGEDNGTHFIVMEFIRGRTLKEAIETEGKLTCQRAVSIMVPILEALGYAHGKGLIHRDVKPQNILLTADGTPRLADFGIAHLADGSTTRTAAILGSAEYLSPEQSRGEEGTELSDIYACGVVLYEMLSGKPPFVGQNALAIAHHHVHSTPPALDQLNPDIGSDLAHAVARALVKDPEKRFTDTAQFAEALQSGHLEIGLTQAQPLLGKGSEGDTQYQAEIAPFTMAPVEGATPRLIIRRSQRKSYVLGVVLTVCVIVAAYAAGLPLLSSRLPAYPSAPYALLPLVCAALVLTMWFNARSWIYTVDANAAMVQWGLIGHHRFGVPLRQVVRLELKQSLIDRVLGVGTVEMAMRDHHGATYRLVMEDVPAPGQTYDDLMQLWGRAVRSGPKAAEVAPR